MNKDPFSYINKGISGNSAVTGTVNSAYSLMMAIGVVGILITIVLTGIKLMSSKPQKRAEALDELKWKAIIAIMLFSMPLLIGVIIKFATAFV